MTKSGYPTVRRISRKPTDDKDESEERENEVGEGENDERTNSLDEWEITRRAYIKLS